MSTSGLLTLLGFLKSSPNIYDDESESDGEEEWISLDNAKNILSVEKDFEETDMKAPETFESNKHDEIEVDKKRRVNDHESIGSDSDKSSETDSSDEDGSAIEEESFGNGTAAFELADDSNNQTASDMNLTSFAVREELTDSESEEEMETESFPVDTLEAILDHTWKDAHKFENIFSSDENGEEVLNSFYSGSLSKEKLLQHLPSLGWIGKADAEFLATGWFMKMTSLDDTGPIAYTFITDAAVICESAFDAMEHMKTKGYRPDVVKAFEDYCTNFTEFNSSMLEEESEEGNNEGEDEVEIIKEDDLSDSDEEQMETVNIMEEDASSDSDDDFNDESSPEYQSKMKEECSFDDALSDSDDDFEEVMEQVL